MGIKCTRGRRRGGQERGDRGRERRGGGGGQEGGDRGGGEERREHMRKKIMKMRIWRARGMDCSDTDHGSRLAASILLST